MFALMEIVFSRDAVKALDAIHRVERARIVEKLEAYAADPRSMPRQVKRLKGDPLLRLRVGDYRILFTEDGIVLTVVRIGHRREVYR